MARNKSICFITNAYPDFESPLYGIFIEQMALLLKESGYQISVVTPKVYQKSHYVEEQKGIRVHRFPFFSENRRLIEYKKIPYLRMFFYYLTGFFLTIYVVLKHQCHLIHAHWAIPAGLIGVLVGSLLKTPLVVTIHGSDFRIGTTKVFVLKRILLYVCKKANHIICVSEVFKRGIEKLGIRGEKISVFPMGVNEAFLRSLINQKVDRIGEHFTILSNRLLLPIYNVSLLIRAIPEVLKEEPNAKFIIAGDGSEREKLEKQVNSLNINSSVQFLGWVMHEEMAKLLSQTDIYVSTSLGDGTSVSLLEAMASGAFPIVTDIPANREWISDGENGFLVPVDQEKSLAEKIVGAIRNQNLRERSRDKNLCLINDKALWRVTIAKTKEIYKMALDSKS
ncbi:MAG: glycosyltransferase [Candidatus Aminicenantes bacterium]|nr:glycosyltransferase [Candidatus Aminicenantes bacterium]